MCGICGFVSKQYIELDTLKAMNDTMYHRGPDDSGQEIYVMKHGYSVGLAQRRLSILDLSDLGHQPMHSANRRLSVVYNGEIYNFLEIRKELSDYPFKSHCDTEVILAAYLKWGISCVDKFNGMFAIAIYDRETEDLYLVRDRVGKKPLYYYTENGNLAFASELKPLMKMPGFKRQIRQDVLSRYLYQQYINAPDSIFENVYKLEPGAILKFHEGEISTWKYWDLATVYQRNVADPVKHYEEAKTELKSLLVQSVKRRMIADVPLGSFLSGGYDSSLISAIAQSVSKEPLKTFSIGFHEESYNEAKYAKEVAKHLGTDHTEMYIGEEEMFKLVRSIPKYFDEPFADSSQIPTMLVSKLAKEKVVVTLSGDGGDEFYCGYNVYEKIAQAQSLDPLGGLVYSVANAGPLEKMHLMDKLPFAVKVIAKNRDAETKSQLVSDHYMRRALGMVANKEIQLPVLYRTESRYGARQWPVRRMLLDIDTYLPGDILCKVDRASMKYSLESRCPILDRDVMEYSFRIPQEYKYYKKDKKHILKDIAYDYIPKELLDRPKVGFSVPLDQWLRGPLKNQLLDYCNEDFLARQGLFDAEFVPDMIYDYLDRGDGGRSTGTNYSRMVWAYLTFQQWYTTYCV